MKVLKITTGPLAVNTYFLINEVTGNAVMIDGGHNYKLIEKYQKDNGFIVKHELLTHAHFDHSLNAVEFQQTGVKIYASEREAEKLARGETLAKDFGLNFKPLTVDEILYDGQEIELEGIKIKVMLTKGHTDGSLTFIVEDKIFSGDTLFYCSYGRTDFPTGDMEEMRRSIKKLFKLKGDYTVYSGHGEDTTLAFERVNNPLG